MEIGDRLLRENKRAIRQRLALCVWLLLLFPGFVVLSSEFIWHIESPIFFSLWMGLGWLAALSGKSWKDERRVTSLLNAEDSPIAVVRVRHPQQSFPWRIVRGCFVVLTERRIVVFTYNKLLDAPSGILWDIERDCSSVEAEVGGGRLVVVGSGESMEFRVPELNKNACVRLVAAIR